MKIDFEYPSDESRHEDMEYDPTSDHSSDSSDFTESEEIDLEQVFPTLDRRIHLAPRCGFCGSAEEFQKK